MELRQILSHKLRIDRSTESMHQFLVIFTESNALRLRGVRLVLSRFRADQSERIGRDWIVNDDHVLVVI